MAQNGSSNSNNMTQQEQQPHISNGGVIVNVGAATTLPMMSGSGSGSGSSRLRPNPLGEHSSETYEDLDLEAPPLFYSSLERYLPLHVINSSREVKVQYMRNILENYIPNNAERTRVEKHREYREKIISSYAPLHKEIYTMDAENFFTPSFLKAIRENTEASFRSVMAEPVRGVYTFEMLQPEFCEMLVSEVDHFEKWVHDTKSSIMRPSTMNRYGAVLDDFGMETMLERMMNDFIRPLSRVFFTEFGGSTLDSHHGFVVEYGKYRDVEIGFHVDDAEVTLNVCLGTEFSGGELFFRGVRCEDHLNSVTQIDEIFDYPLVPGQAILHAGRHRHGARPTTSGHRMNLILWCRSSVFREMKKYQREFPEWCGECKRWKKERERILVAATKQELLKGEFRPAP